MVQIFSFFHKLYFQYLTIYHSLQHLQWQGIQIWIIILGIVLSAVLVRVHFLWRYITRFAILMAHEGGHSLFATILTLELPKINLHHDTTGQTWSHCGSGLRKLLITMAGYPFPSTLGLLGAYLLGHGATSFWFILLTVLLCVELIFLVRNFFGILIVAVALVLVYGITQLSGYGQWVDQLIGVISIGVLGLGGLETSKEVLDSQDATSDLGIVSGITHVPASIAGKMLILFIIIENIISLYFLFR